MKPDLTPLAYAAFMMEGFNDKVRNEALELGTVFGVDYIVWKMVEAVPYMCGLVHHLEEIIPDLVWSGVFEYEVCAPYGGWYAKTVADFGGNTPLEPTVTQGKVRNYVREFFDQTYGLDRREAIRKAVNDYVHEDPDLC